MGQAVSLMMPASEVITVCNCCRLWGLSDTIRGTETNALIR